MTRVVVILCLICTAGARGQSISEGQAQVYVKSWLKGNPLAVRHRQVQGLALESGEVERLALEGSQPPFYVIHLRPQGYVIMSSDRRLRPVVCFDFSGSLDLGKQEDNALYQFLLVHGRKNAQIVASGAPALAAWDLQSSLRIQSGEPNIINDPLKG